MDMLQGAPITSVILIAVIIILLYLYRTSELMNKRRLRWAIGISIVAVIAVNLVILLQQRHRSLKFHAAVIPFSIDPSLGENSAWLQLAIPEIIGESLQRQHQPEAVVSTLEWTYSVLAPDSLVNNDYRLRVIQRLPFSYILSGYISGTADSLSIKYQLVQKNGSAWTFEQVITPEHISQDLQIVITAINDHLPKHKIQSSFPVFHYPTPALQWYFNGLRCYLGRDFSGALAVYQNVPEGVTRFPEADLIQACCNFQAGVMYRQQGKQNTETSYFSTAKTLAEEVIAQDTLLTDANRLLGEYYLYSERWSMADFYLRKALKQNPLNYRIYHPLSRLNRQRFSQLGFRTEKDVYEWAIYVNPCYTDGYIAISDILLFENKRDDAITILKKFLVIHPNSVPALMALGKIYIVRNEMFPIMDVLTRVIKIDPTNSDAYYNLGILYYNSNDYDNAVRFFEKAIAIDNHLNSHVYLAYIYEARGDVDKAISYLRLRIRNKTGPNDEYAEEARRHLFNLMHPDTVQKESINK
jgi:tetratricopeptide (TPR) repeat protein